MASPARAHAGQAVQAKLKRGGENFGAGLFPEIVLRKVVKTVDEPIAKKRGKVATWLYVVLMIAALVLMALYYGTKRETKIIEVPPVAGAGPGGEPMVPLRAYLDIKEHNPVCPCGSPDSAYGDMVSAEMTFHEACGDAKFIYRSCSADPTAANCAGLEPEFGLPVFGGIVRLCNASFTAVSTAVLDLQSTSLVTPNLLSQKDFWSDVQFAQERTVRSAVHALLAPIRLVEALNSIERPLSAVTIGSGEQPRPAASGEDEPTKLAMGRDGWAFVWDEPIPGTDIACDCFRSFECSAPIAPEFMAGVDTARQHCTLFKTMQSVPIEIVVTDANDPPEERRRRAQLGDRLGSRVGDVLSDDPVERKKEESGIVDPELGDTVGDLINDVPAAKDYCCGDPGPVTWCKAREACFITSKCCELARSQNGINERSTKAEAVRAFAVYHAAQITTGPFKQIMDQGFLQTFALTPNYGAYYNACRPTKCEYFEESGLEPYEILVTIMGIVGGISVSIKACLTVAVEVLPDSWMGARDRLMTAPLPRGSSGRSDPGSVSSGGAGAGRRKQEAFGSGRGD